jgi:phage major head subunit gpT-like protein
MGFDISKDDIVDDTIGLFGDVVADAGRARAEFPDANVFATSRPATANALLGPAVLLRHRPPRRHRRRRGRGSSRTC